MRVFSQINNCQQKQNKTKKQKQKQKTDKTKRGAPLLGFAKSIYYVSVLVSDPFDKFSKPRTTICPNK